MRVNTIPKLRKLFSVVSLCVFSSVTLAQQPPDEALVYEGKHLNHWLTAFDKGASQPDRDQAVKAVQAIGQSAVPYLIAMLTNDVAQTTRLWRASHALVYLAPVAEPAVPALLTCLKHNDDDVLINAMVALASIGKKSELVVPAFSNQLNSASASVRRYAVMTLWEFRSSSLAKPLFEKAASDVDETVRKMASKALRGVNPDSPDKE